MNKERINKSCKTIINSCSGLNGQEKLLIVSEPSTKEIGDILENIALAISKNVRHEVIMPFEIHGQEPSGHIAQCMSDSNVIIGLTKMSMAHTKARYDATLKGARYLSLPDYSLEVLNSEAFDADFIQIGSIADKLADKFSKGKTIRVLTTKGTDLKLTIEGRSGNSAPGFCHKPGSLSSPPDAESNVAPIEENTNGVIYVDGSIPCPDIGLLKEGLKLYVENGKVVKVEGEKSDTVNYLFDRVNNPASRVVAEFGVGLNAFAKLSGRMLEDEGSLGTVHFGIGSNATIGGKNKVPFHLDFVVKDVSFWIDNEQILADGKLLI